MSSATEYTNLDSESTHRSMTSSGVEKKADDYLIQDLSSSSSTSSSFSNGATMGWQGNSMEAFPDPMLTANFFWMDQPNFYPRPSLTPPQTHDYPPIQQTPIGTSLPGSSLAYTPESPDGYPQYPYFPIPPLIPQVNTLTPCLETPKIQANFKKEAKKTKEKDPEEIKKLYPTFGEPVTEDREKNYLDEVDGRLPTVGDRSKYVLTVDELRRRTNAPEYMNLSSVYGFFRKSKKKDSISRLKKSLAEKDVVIPRMQRQRKLNAFSSLLEEEAIILAKDLEQLAKRYFPLMDVGHQMLQNLMKMGHSAKQCEEFLNQATYVMDLIITAIKSRQPQVRGAKEILKGTRLDVPYHAFSNSLHGFGHLNSLNHYNRFREIMNYALILSRKMQKGETIPVIEWAVPNEKPFELMSDYEYEKMMSGRGIKIQNSGGTNNNNNNRVFLTTVPPKIQ